MLVILAGVGSASAHRSACPGTNPPNELVLFGGSDQTAQLGSQFAANLEVQLANSNGCPVTGNLAGVDVEFDAPTSGPSGSFAASNSRAATAGTDSQGVATAPPLTANDLAGTYTVTARSDLGDVDFNLRNTANGVATAISSTSGNGQAAVVFGRYAAPLQARVTDVNGNPVQGTSVTFSVVTGATGAGASFAGSVQAAAKTNASGYATSLPLIANGNPGRFTVVASADGVLTIATYTLDNHSATQRLVAVRDAKRSATIYTSYGAPLMVQMLDSTGQPIEGGVVTFTLGTTSGASSITASARFRNGTSEAISITDASGIASSPIFTANGSPGTFDATAAVAGSAPIVFVLTNLSARLTLTAAQRRTTVDQPFLSRLVATVRDSRGRPISGLSIVFAVSPAGSASAMFREGNRQPTVLTAANGRATAPVLVANMTAGTFDITARIAGTSEVATAELRSVAAHAAAVTVGAASGESTACLTSFPVPLAVTVADRYGNRVARADVTFTAPSHGATGGFAVVRRRMSVRSRSVTVKTNANGIAVAPRFTANQRVGGYLVKAAVKGSDAHASFALINTPGV